MLELGRLAEEAEEAEESAKVSTYNEIVEKRGGGIYEI